MHELSLCRAIIGIINEHIAGKHCKRIKKITIEIGQLAAVDESALRFGFEAITKGTLAEQADLDIITLEGQAVCESCKKTVVLQHYYDPCQTCGHFALKVTQGEEMRVKSLEIE
jgi:hydrogenase nickel incorporation protein HypA/HybF